MEQTKKAGKYIAIPVVACILVMAAIVAFALFMPMSTKADKHYVYIDTDDTIDSLYQQLDTVAHGYSMCAFKALARQTGYDQHVRTGRYEIDSDVSALQAFRHFRNGIQSPVMVTIPSVRTIDRLASEVSKHLMMDEDQLYNALTDEKVCEKYSLDTLTIQCLFIPNTYDMYWNISVSKFLDRMKQESDRFWTSERKAKAQAAGLTENQVITLASIIDEETANDGEKPMIAGMYLNRFHQGMPLQADPTIKYALKQFGLRRIYNDLLFVDSPFNTYRHEGLPPGPIRIPSVAGIDAVLNYVHHGYMFMCAKEDFSGTHNFAVTYSEHLQNAARYSAALNKRGIK